MDLNHRVNLSERIYSPPHSTNSATLPKIVKKLAVSSGVEPRPRKEAIYLAGSVITAYEILTNIVYYVKANFTASPLGL